MQQNIPSK